MSNIKHVSPNKVSPQATHMEFKNIYRLLQNVGIQGDITRTVNIYEDTADDVVTDWDGIVDKLVEIGNTVIVEAGESLVIAGDRKVEGVMEVQGEVKIV